MERKIVKCDKAPGAIGPYVQGVCVGDLVFLSGALGVDPVSGNMPETIEGQTKQAMQNIAALLESEGLTFDNVVKTTCFLDKISDFAAFNEIYASFFGNSFPARSCFEVGALPKAALVEIEVIAAR